MIHVIITEDLCSLQGLHHILFILPLQFIILKKLSWSSDDIFKFYVCSGDDSQDKKTSKQTVSEKCKNGKINICVLQIFNVSIN